MVRPDLDRARFFTNTRTKIDQRGRDSTQGAPKVPRGVRRVVRKTRSAGSVAADCNALWPCRDTRRPKKTANAGRDLIGRLAMQFFSHLLAARNPHLDGARLQVKFYFEVDIAVDYARGQTGK